MSSISEKTKNKQQKSISIISYVFGLIMLWGLITWIFPDHFSVNLESSKIEQGKSYKVNLYYFLKIKKKC
jgi:hypothetical protein